MVEIFGYEKTEAFCELNAYKYHYRHELKNGQEDLDKASNYENMLQQMISNDPRFKIAEHYGCRRQMQQLIEEMSELTQALCKCFRSNGEVHENLIEELADVKLVLDQVIFLLACNEEVLEIMKQKTNRTIERMKGDD